MQNIEKSTTSVPIVVILPSIFGPIFCGEGKMSWELHIIVKALVQPKDREMKRPVRPILEWLIRSCVKVRNEDKSSADTDMSVVTLPSQKLKAWQKLRLEGTIGKWTEVERVAAPQIITGSAVAAAASLSVSQAKIFYVQGANTPMKVNGTIAGYSTTGRKKFTDR